MHIPEGILVGSIVGFAYLFVYIRESGFYYFFKIPQNLIRITLEQILINSVLFIAIFLAIFYFIFSLDFLIRSLKNKPFPYLPQSYYSRAVKVFFIALAIYLLVLEGNSAFHLIDPRFEKPFFYIITFIFSFVFVLGMFVYPALLDRRIRNKPIDPKNKQENGMRISILSKVVKFNMFDILVIIIILLSLLGLAYMLGYENASEREVHYVLDTNPEQVVLQFSGENIISAPFDRDKNEIQPQFSVFRIADKPALKLKFEKLGKLSLAK